MQGGTAALAWVLAAPAPGAALQKQPAPVAIIAGTVFREPGFALGGARIVLEPKPAPAPSGSSEANRRDRKPRTRVRKLETFSDSRGEYTFRVPPSPMRYNLVVTASGHLPETREVIVDGEGRQDIYVTLRPAP